MVNTVGIEDSEARTFSIFSSITAQEQVTAGRVFAVYNLPTDGENVSQFRNLMPVTGEGDIDVSEVRAFALIRGRIDNPKLRVWPFTLDAHDFFVVRLGDDTTLVYDLFSEQWVDWDSAENGAWRPNTGMTWVGGQAFANIYGSAVVAGDDTFGLLWFLDPELAWDENPDDDRAPQQVAFDRAVTGQVALQGRQSVPCYAMFLYGDNYGLTADDFTPAVRLEISDDQGRTFVDAGTITVSPDYNTQNPYQWLSLGQIESPGRLFRITDNGVFARIDSMSMNDDAG